MLSTEAVRGFVLTIDPDRSLLVKPDMETIHPSNGVSWFEGGRTSEYDDIYSELWLPNHSQSLLDRLGREGGISLTGTVGAGKSTLLYGARALMRAQGIPYVNINGHYESTTAEQIIEAVDSAEENGMTIICDSADYLVSGRTRKTRSLPLAAYIPRNLAIMQRLIEFRQRGGNLLLSSHHQDWIEDRAHPDLRPTWDELVSYTVPEEVDIVLPSAAERAVLMRKMGVRGPVADFVAQLPEDQGFLDHIANRWGDKRYMEWAQRELSRYDILKLLARDNYEENKPVVEAITGTVDAGRPREESWDAVLQFTYSKTYLLTFFTR